jgi:ribosomal 30S subunit maturation factor RimM
VTETAAKPGFEPVLIGRITGLFGVRGWVRVFSFTDPREAVLGYGPWWVRQDGVWHPVRAQRPIATRNPIRETYRSNDRKIVFNGHELRRLPAR